VSPKERCRRYISREKLGASSTLSNGTEKPTDWNAIKLAQSQSGDSVTCDNGSFGQHKEQPKKGALTPKAHGEKLLEPTRQRPKSNADECWEKTPGLDKLVLKTPAARGKMVDVLAHYTVWNAQTSETSIYTQKQQ